METNNTKQANNKVEETAKKLPTPLYAIKTFNGYIGKVEALGLLKKEEIEQLKELGKKMVAYYMGEPML